jgi:hypothetical protein
MSAASGGSGCPVGRRLAAASSMSSCAAPSFAAKASSGMSLARNRTPCFAVSTATQPRAGPMATGGQLLRRDDRLYHLIRWYVRMQVNPGVTHLPRRAWARVWRGGPALLARALVPRVRARRRRGAPCEGMGGACDGQIDKMLQRRGGAVSPRWQPAPASRRQAAPRCRGGSAAEYCEHRRLQLPWLYTCSQNARQAASQPFATCAGDAHVAPYSATAALLFQPTPSREFTTSHAAVASLRSHKTWAAQPNTLCACRAPHGRATHRMQASSHAASGSGGRASRSRTNCCRRPSSR